MVVAECESSGWSGTACEVWAPALIRGPKQTSAGACIAEGNFACARLLILRFIL